MKWISVGLLITATAIAWGLYAPIVQIASEKLGSDLRALLLVGLSYFAAGVLLPVACIMTETDPTVRVNAEGTSTANFSQSGIAWGLAAGISGVAGALCMILALTKAGPGAAVYVAPLVFAAVPIINTAAAVLWLSPVRTRPSWPFLLGLVLTAAGALMILLFKPADPEPETPTAAATVDSQLD